MSDTPDLDKAREALAKVLYDETIHPEVYQRILREGAQVVMEQRAEEAERGRELSMYQNAPARFDTRAADLRRQAEGGK